MTNEAFAIYAVFVLVVFTLWLMGHALDRIRNRIRRLEWMVGVDDIPPDQIEKPHWNERGERQTINQRVERIESHLVL